MRPGSGPVEGRQELLDRARELARLDQLFDEARRGAGRLVLVGGEAGIGKTALTDAFCTRHAADALVLKGYCDPILTPSVLGPLHDMAAALGDPAALELSGKASDVFKALLDLLRRSQKPVVMLIEDLHWADEATLDLLKFLSRRIVGERAVIIATFRDDDVERRPALQRLLGLVGSAQATSRMHLPGLSLEAVKVIAGGLVQDAETVHRQTGGNAFFVTEIVASPSGGLPATVRDAVLARAGQLDPAARALLDYAAVAGARIEIALLEPLGEAGAVALADWMRHGIMIETKEGVSFRHELARNAVLEAINPLARRRLYRQVLDAASNAGFERQGLHARLAHYAEGAGSGPHVLHHTKAAARGAAASGAHREAAAHYRTMARFAENAGPEQRAEILAALAREATVIDHLDEAAAAFRSAIGLWTEVGDDLKRGEALASLAWALVRNGENAAAERSADEAIAVLEPLGKTAELASAYRIKAHLAMLDRDLPRAVTIGERAAAVAAACDANDILAAAEMVIGTAKLVGDDAAGREHLDRCLEIARATGSDDTIALAYLNLGSSYGEQYHLEAAEAELRKGLEVAGEHDLDLAANYLSAWLALVAMLRGRWTEAEATARALLAQDSLSAISRIMALVALGRVLVRRGDPGAGPILDEALTLARRTATLQRLAPVHAARAEQAWLAGDAARLAAEARAVLPLALVRRHAWHSGELLYWLTKAGTAPELCPWAASPYALQCDGLWREAAEAWRRRGCPYEEARALAEGDRAAEITALQIFDGLGAIPAATALRRRLREAGEERIPRGPRASTRSNPFALTARELEVLARLVRGDANRSIAKDLFVSVKTIDHHVSAILAKLGAASRNHAAAIARRDGLVPQNGEAGGAK